MNQHSQTSHPHRERSLSRTVVCWFALVLLCQFPCAQAFEYEASGVFNGEMYFYRSKAGQKIASLPFTVSVRDCQWLIRAQPSSGRDIVRSFDGSDQYAFGSFPGSGGETYWDGGIDPEKVPFFGPTPHIPIIWTALASSCYLKKAEGKMTAPYSVDAPRPEVEIHVRSRKDGVGLPEAITFRSTGFTNAEFRAAGFRTVGGVEIPSEFSLKVYLKNHETGESFLVADYRGSITNVNAKCSLGTFVPEIPPGTAGRVQDGRFVEPGAIYVQEFGYRTSNWLTRDEVKKLPGFAEYAAMQPRISKIVLPKSPIADMGQSHQGQSHQSSSGRWVVILSALVVLSVLSLIFFWKGRSKDKGK